MDKNEDVKKEVKSTVSKNKKTNNEKGYNYKYTDLAQIHEYLEENDMRYFQYIDRIDNDDYIMTVPIIKDEEKQPRRGVRVVEATLIGIKNPAQEQGSAISYARRYSLLMAFGLATEDDDAQSLSKPKEEKKITTKEEAEAYVITFGKKHPGETLGEIYKSDPSYIDYLLNGEKTDENIKEAINLITKSNNIDDLQKQLINTYINENLTNLEGILTQYNVESLAKLTYEEAEQVIKICQQRKAKISKEKKEVF